MADAARSQAAAPIFGYSIASTLSTWASNFHRNTSKAFEDLQPQAKIRLVIIVCAYFLLRPYLVRVGAWLQMRDLERQSKKAERGALATFDANDTRRTRLAIPGIDPEDEERDEAEALASASNWGRRAKMRQRARFRLKLEEHEARLREMQETESDREIEDLLED